MGSAVEGGRVVAEVEKVRDADGVLPLIQSISDLINRRCDRFLTARYGLTMPQYQLLLAAAQGENLTLGELSEHLNCSRGNVTGIVDRLERGEWLCRERSTEDRRVITVRVTEKGSQVHEIQRELDRELASLAVMWNTDQQTMLVAALERIVRELREG